MDVLALAPSSDYNCTLPFLTTSLLSPRTCSPDVSPISLATAEYSDNHGRAQPSESLILSHITALENIGYRSVGTYQSKAGEEYIVSQVRLLESRCAEGGVLNCEVWVQKGSGFHAYVVT